MIKRIIELRDKLGGVLSLGLWLPAFGFGYIVFYLAFAMLSDPSKFFEYHYPSQEIFYTEMLRGWIAYALFFIPTFAYGLFVRIVANRATKFGKLAFSIPLMLLFAAEIVLALSLIFTTADGAREIGWSSGFAAAICAESATVLGGLWLFRLYVNPSNPNFAATLGLLCICGTLVSFLGAAYLDGIWPQVYLICATSVGAALALDISFRGSAYTTLYNLLNKIA